MDFRILLKILGGLLIILGALICLPGVFSAFSEQQSAVVFLDIALGCVTVGLLLWLSQRNYTAELGHRTGFAVVGFSWFTACVVGALPYYLTGTLDTFLDSFFESASGFSGTGASVMTVIDGTDRAILLWRSMTQWLGGMGIIVFFIAILPILGLGGVQLFKAEITGPSKDKITPRVRETAKNLWFLYVALTATIAFSLWTAGMSRFDALNHAFTAASTGGFSTHNSGVAHFQNPTIEYLLAIFMLIASINFALHFRLIVQRDARALLATELKWYLWIIFAAVFVMVITVWPSSSHSFERVFRETFFTVTCTVSSTGFTNVDYTHWPEALQMIIVLLMIMGGMSGSTAGGIKCIRAVAAVKQLAKELKQIIHPSAILTVKADNHSIPFNIVNAIWGFIFLYFFVFALMTLLLCFQGIDMVSASTASFSMLSNIGPALGELGPYDNFASLNDTSKIILSAGMLLGRLEFYTLLVIFTPEYWRK